MIGRRLLFLLYMDSLLVFCLPSGVVSSVPSDPSGEKSGGKMAANVQIGLGVAAVAVVATIALIVAICVRKKKKKKKKKRDEGENSSITEKEKRMTVWRKRRDRRKKRRSVGRIPKGNISMFANPRTLKTTRKATDGEQKEEFVLNRRMRRCAHRAEARGLARIRAHSRAHFRKMRARRRQGRGQKQSKTKGATETSTGAERQKRMKSKLLVEPLGRVTVGAEAWRRLEVPKKKEITVPERTIKNVPSQKENFIPTQERLDKFVKKKVRIPDERRPDSAEGVPFCWPLTEKALKESFPKEATSYKYTDELGGMITKWADMGVFRMEHHVRAQRTTTGWNYSSLAEEKNGETVSRGVRVQLDTRKWPIQRDSIEASYCGVAEDPTRFICCPVPDEMSEFAYWTMLLDHGCKCVVQLNSWDFRGNRLALDEMFLPFGRQMYITMHEEQPEMDSSRKGESKAKRKDLSVEYLDYRARNKQRTKLSRKQSRRQTRRRLSVKKRQGRPGEKARNGARKEETVRERPSEAEVTKRKRRRRDGQSRSRQFNRKKRRNQRRWERRSKEGEGVTIFVKKLSVRYLVFPHRPTGVRLARHSSQRLFWRLVHLRNEDMASSFIVRVSLLRVLCREMNISHLLVHFHVWNLAPFAAPTDFLMYRELVSTVNKIPGTVNVMSQRCLSRAPPFCMTALLLNRLKQNQPPLNPVELYAQLQIDRPYAFLRPSGFFIAMRTLLDYVLLYERWFPLTVHQKKALGRLREDVTVGLAIGRF